MISSNGKVEKGRWEYLGNNSLLIERKDESFLFKHGFFDENVMALKIDGKEEYALLINENRFDGELNSKEKGLQFLSNQYLSDSTRRLVEQQSGIAAKHVVKTKEEIEEEKRKRVINNLALFTIIATMILISYFLSLNN